MTLYPKTPVKRPLQMQHQFPLDFLWCIFKYNYKNTNGHKYNTKSKESLLLYIIAAVYWCLKIYNVVRGEIRILNETRLRNVTGEEILTKLMIRN